MGEISQISIFANGQISTVEISRSYFLITVHEKWPVSDKRLQTRKTNNGEAYRKNSKMLTSSHGISDCCAIYLLKNIRNPRQEIFCKKMFLKILQNL